MTNYTLTIQSSNGVEDSELSDSISFTTGKTDDYFMCYLKSM